MEVQVQQALSEWGDAAWRLAAVGLALSGRQDEAALAAADVVALLGLELPDGEQRPLVAGQAAAPLVETVALLSGSAGWADQPDEALLAHGRQSGQAAALFRSTLMPSMPGLSEALEAPGARMLDVGTGVGALAAGFLSAYPELEVVGLDVLPRVLALAEQAGHGPRLHLRLQDVATLEDESAYDFAWVPARFLPQPVLDAALPRIARAMRPGGWVTLGHDALGDDPLPRALARLRLAAWGGTLLDGPAAHAVLEAAGLVDVRSLPMPRGAPAVSAGRAPRG